MTPRILMIIPPKDFRDEELMVPRKALKDKGWQVDTASTATCEAMGMLGARETVTLALADVILDDYDALVVVGGMGSPEYLWQNDRLRRFVSLAYQQGKVVSAICLSGAVLGLAGILQGKKATVWETPESRAAIEENGGTFTDESVTVDGTIVTANGPDAAEAFGDALIKAIEATLSVKA